MIRFVLSALCLTALSHAPVSAQPEELSAAVDAYLKDDFSHVDVIARYAEDGTPEALGILGQAYLYGSGVETDKLLGVALLEQAASLGQRSSAIQLGRVYEFGNDVISADAATAARWYVQAAKAGDTASAPAALKRLPADVVIAAGGAAWADPDPAAETTAQVAAVAPLPANIEDATRTVFSPPQGVPSSDMSGAVPVPSGNTGQTAPAQPHSPASAILGNTTAPPPLVMNDGTSFPIFADTRLSAAGDAAASCQVVLKPEIERQKQSLEELMKLDGFGNTEADKPRYAELAETDNRIDAYTSALQASETLLNDARRNGGLNTDAVKAALTTHGEAFANRPNSGPPAALCGQRIVALIGESASWKTP